MSITIYSTHTCAYCKMLMDYLNSKNIAYEVKYADDNQQIAEELYTKSHQLAVPYTIISDEAGKESSVLGFDKPKIDQLLNLA